MKTREEIDEMFRQYESKWGKLGHTSILHPERNREEKTMSIMDNELYKFRQKVFNGKEANKVSHKSMVNVTELNRQYFEKVTTDGTLIHAQNPLYGQQNPNAKYYKREGQPGKYRYYYTKEEWDAAHKQGSASTEANRESQARQQYENNKKASNNNGSSKFNNMRADVVNEYAKIAREASSKDAAKAFYDMAKGGNEAIDELYSTIQDGFKSGKLSYKDGRFETDDDQLREDIESFSDNIQKFAKQIGEASGKGREIQDELEKLMLPDIEAMSKKEQNTKKDNSRKQELAKSNKANRLDNGENVKTNETNFSEDKEKGEKLITGDSKEAQEMRIAYNDLWDESWKDDYDHSNYQEGANRQFKSLYKTAKLLEMYGMNPSNDLKSAYSYIKPNSKEGQNIIKEADKEFEEFMKSHKHLEKYFSNKKENNSVKHSTSGKTLITNSAMGDEIVDEYKAFQEKVKKGKEKNRLAHTATISPAMLNARYEEELSKKGILIHQANYKYYNKIDLGNGNTRYFYTKAEWDAYQREKGSKTNTNQKLSADTLKQIEQEKQQKDTFEKNKAADEAQKKAESDKWNTHKKIREDFHQVPGYMSYSSRFTDTMKETPEGSKEGKDYLFNVMYDAYKKYPKMKNIRTISSNQKDKPKDEEVFGFMDEIQKGIDKYTSDFINKYELPKEEYAPLINNYFLSVANNLMKDNALDYDYISDVYYRNSDVGKKETKAQEILKQGDFRDHVFPEQIQNGNMIEGLNRSTGEELVEKTENSATYKGIDRDTDEQYQAALKSFAETRPAQYIKEEYDNLKNRRTNDGKQQYSDEDIYNAIYKFLHRNVQQWAIKQNDFNPNIFYLIPDLLKTMGINGAYTADPQDLILKIK